MRLSLIFLTFLTVLLLNSTHDTSKNLGHLILNAQIGDNQLESQVCKIINDVVNLTAETQDVLIANLGGKIWSSTVNDILTCLGSENAVVASDFRESLREKSLRKASIVILTLNRIDMSLITAVISNQLYSTIWHHMAKIICIVPSTKIVNERMELLNTFVAYGFYNVAIVYRTNDDNIEFEFMSSLAGDVSVIINSHSSSDIFPDNFKDMQGYYYQIAVYFQPPTVFIINNSIVSPMVFFLAAVQKAQNAKIRMNILPDYTYMVDYWRNRMMHLTLNTATSFDTSEPKLLTYEANGFCALIPRPQKASFTSLIFIKPFDGLTWMLLALTIVCSVAVWWLFRGRGAVDSPSLIAYGIFMIFVRQGVAFSPKNRLVLTILVHLTSVMIFVLSNAYEGMISSFMIEPPYENRLETVGQLLTSDYDIMTDEKFMFEVKDSEEFNAIRSRINTSALLITDHYQDEIMRQHYVFIRLCDNIEYDFTIKLTNGRHLSDYYYMLPEKIATYYVQLEASYLNPFIERLQYYMDLCFQAGLPQIWKVYTHLDFSKESNESEDVTYLKLKDMTQVFAILFIGYGLSLAALLIEIFCHDCLKNVELVSAIRKIKKRFIQILRRLLPKKLNVRRIFVQPRNQNEL